MTTLNNWDLLNVDTKISILVTLGVLDLPLCEIKMKKVSKYQGMLSVKQDVAKYAFFFEDDRVVNVFKIIAIAMRKQLQKQSQQVFLKLVFVSYNNS